MFQTMATSSSEIRNANCGTVVQISPPSDSPDTKDMVTTTTKLEEFESSLEISDESYDNDGDGRLGKINRDPMSHRIIEKRRRDRMNNCLTNLSKLIPSSYLRKGRGRVEKTEIIEMAIRYLRQLQQERSKLKPYGLEPTSFQPTTAAFEAKTFDRVDHNVKKENSSPSTSGHVTMDSTPHITTTTTASTMAVFEQRYQQGFYDCIAECLRFMAGMDGVPMTDGLKNKLLIHLRDYCQHVLVVQGNGHNKQPAQKVPTAITTSSEENIPLGAIRPSCTNNLITTNPSAIVNGQTYLSCMQTTPPPKSMHSHPMTQAPGNSVVKPLPPTPSFAIANHNNDEPLNMSVKRQKLDDSIPAGSPSHLRGILESKGVKCVTPVPYVDFKEHQVQERHTSSVPIRPSAVKAIQSHYQSTSANVADVASKEEKKGHSLMDKLPNSLFQPKPYGISGIAGLGLSTAALLPAAFGGAGSSSSSLQYPSSPGSSQSINSDPGGSPRSPPSPPLLNHNTAHHNSSLSGSSTVPIFALHISGLFYVPCTVPAVLLDASVQCTVMPDHAPISSLGVCHPVTIPVNFSLPAAVSSLAHQSLQSNLGHQSNDLKKDAPKHHHHRHTRRPDIQIQKHNLEQIPEDNSLSIPSNQGHEAKSCRPLSDSPNLMYHPGMSRFYPNINTSGEISVQPGGGWNPNMAHFVGGMPPIILAAASSTTSNGRSPNHGSDTQYSTASTHHLPTDHSTYMSAGHHYPNGQH